MRLLLCALIAWPLLAVSQGPPEIVLSPALLEQVYPGYSRATGLVQDKDRLWEVRTLAVQPFDEAATLILAARLPVYSDRQPASNAEARIVDVVIVDSLGQAIRTGLELFEFDGHSRVGLDPESYPDLDGGRLLGFVDHHTNQGVDGDTIHLVRIGSGIREVLSVRTLFSECDAVGADQSAIVRERVAIVFAPADPHRLELMTAHETCDGALLAMESAAFGWDPEAGHFVPEG